jgi:RNA polymerase sigma factor (sigma-70 family)
MSINPELLLAHQDFVRVLARSLVADAHDAEDVAQETWLRVLRRGKEPTRTPRTWLARIVRNAAHDKHRREASARRRKEAKLKTAAIPTTADVVEREAARKEIVDTVLGLREPYRTAILLRFYELLPPRAIASRLGEPVETVRTRVKRGVEMLRSALDIVPGRPRRSRGFLALARPLSEGFATRIVAAGVAMKTSSKVMLAAALLLLVGVVAPFWLLSGVAPSRPLSTSSAPDDGREPAATTSQASGAAQSAHDRHENAPASHSLLFIDEWTSKAVPGVEVTAAGALLVIADDNGAASVPDTHGAMVAVHRDYLPHPVILASLEERSAVTHVAMRRGGTVLGVVLDQDGSPIRGARVHVSRGGACKPAVASVAASVMIDSVGDGSDGLPVYIRTEVSDADGHFRISGLAFSEHLLDVEVFGYALDAPSQALVVTPPTADTLVLMRRVYVGAFEVQNRCSQCGHHDIRHVRFNTVLPRALQTVTSTPVVIQQSWDEFVQKQSKGVAIRHFALARSQSRIGDSGLLVPATVTTICGDVDKLDVPYVPLTQFTGANLPRLPICDECTGEAVITVDCAFDLVVVAGGANGLSHEFWVKADKTDGGRQLFSIPVSVGEAILRPAQHNLVDLRKRDTHLNVIAGGRTRIECPDALSGLTLLRIDVRDLSGRPTTEYSLRILQRGSTKEVFMNGRRLGSSISIPAEPLEYTIELMDLGGTVRNSVTVIAGSTDVPVVLSM